MENSLLKIKGKVMEKKFSHYFTNDESKEYRTYENIVEFNGKKYKYKTQDGVFSKNGIDDGSLFLVQTALKDNICGKGLDLGCGCGAISLLLQDNADVNMLGGDINERAVNLANDNFNNNHIKAKAVVADVSIGIEDDDFDFVITNPPIRVGNATLFRFFEESISKLKSGGAFYAVLRKKQGAESYSKKIGNIYGNYQILDKHKGYVIVKSIKD